MPTFFVTGTDTDVGKTFTTLALMAAARAQGLSVLGLKPLAAGCHDTPDGLRNDDALALQAASSIRPLWYEEVNPVALPQACSPHIAARAAGRRLAIAQLAGFVRGSLGRRADFMLVEGAGGWRVPISEREFLSALPRALNLPVILVVGIRLGCLNAALLTAEAILRDGVKLAGWVANVLEPDMVGLDDNIASLRQWLPAPCLGVLPWQAGQAPDDVAARLDLQTLLPPPA